MPVRLLADARCLLGECPLWDPGTGRFRWLDLARGVLHEASPEGDASHRASPVDPPLGGLVHTPGGVGIVHGGGVTGADGAPLLAARLARGGAHPNDAKVDRAGGLWVATADDGEADATGRLLRIGPGGSVLAFGPPMVVGNGPAFSPDGGTVYWCDTLDGRVLAAPLAGGAPRTVLVVPPEEGYPDGLTVSADGTLWIALWDGGAVLRAAPDGRVLDRIAVPAPLVTSVAFGGPGLDLLIITTARWELDDEALARHPLSGGAFLWQGDAVGLPEPVLRLPAA